jgi:hypothetical protein
MWLTVKKINNLDNTKLTAFHALKQSEENEKVAHRMRQDICSTCI